MTVPETSTACIKWNLLTAKITSIVVRKGVLIWTKSTRFTAKVTAILPGFGAKLNYVTFLAIRVQTPRKFSKCRYSLLSCLCDILCAREKRRNSESWGRCSRTLPLLLLYIIYNISSSGKCYCGGDEGSIKILGGVL